MIEEPARRANQPFSEEDVSWLLKMAGRHPFFLQVACRHLFAARALEKERPLHLGQLRRVLYQELAPHFLQAWEDLNEEQKNVLKQEIVQPASHSSLYPELSESLLFRKKVYDISQDLLSGLTTDELRIALDHLNDLEFLATSKFGELQYVCLQIMDSASSSSNRRGMLVREMLKKALELMSPDTMRSDAALEWRHYNILWYHYYKYNLANNHTAGRLSISPRQFYREQEKALQMLLKEVLDLEAQALDSLFS